ncbi:helix-turn-helix transcriptional regulator [uncultured Acinetobacter sp.]|uniref:helix-turn-helix domain-containing protein n=1 Tax=uncultured Acinetobacter sp. TaxID=165433 RepID=UPI002584565E|nr:helix-turn-helix transcriptional regulator [uncultured Acinetobacter sp.]
MDLNFIKPEEVVTLLGERLRKQRLFLEMSQAEVASRSGVGVNTVSNLEAGRNVSVENLVRIAMVLGRLYELQELFQPQLNSVNDILRYENQSKRHRIKRKN